MAILYHILTKEELEQLEGYRTRKYAARKLFVSTALLRMDEGRIHEVALVCEKDF